MPPIHSRAFRGAATMLVLAAACQDSPVEPRGQHPRPEPVVSAQSSVRTFSGHAADSVMSILESSWKNADGTDPRRTRLAWRTHNGVPETVGDSSVTPPRLGPSLMVVGGEEGGVRPLPQIVAHYEQLYFGRYGTIQVPSAVEAEMTFVGDYGEIELGNLTITRTDGGAPFTTSGRIAAGSGELLSCGDIMFNQCQNRRHLSGLIVLGTAPSCNASGNGNVNYYATSLTTALSSPFLQTPLSSTEASASANGAIGNGAPPCEIVTPGPRTPGEETGGEAGQPTGGAGAAPPPDPWEPPPVPPSPGDNDGPTTMFCGNVIYSQIIAGQEYFLTEVTVCYRA